MAKSTRETTPDGKGGVNVRVTSGSGKVTTGNLTRAQANQLRVPIDRPTRGAF